MLKDSLTGKVVDISQNFVGQVFLPILDSFSKTPVCLLPYDHQENKILFDMSSLSMPVKEDRISMKNKTPKFRLPSNILPQNSKEELFNFLNERCGCKGGNFNLAVNHMSDAIGLCDTL